MTITKAALEQQLSDVQSQIDMLRREFDLFRGYTNQQFNHIDLRFNDMATKVDLQKVQNDVTTMSKLLIRIAHKVGVKTA